MCDAGLAILQREPRPADTDLIKNFVKPSENKKKQVDDHDNADGTNERTDFPRARFRFHLHLNTTRVHNLFNHYSFY